MVIYQLWRNLSCKRWQRSQKRAIHHHVSYFVVIYNLSRKVQIVFHLCWRMLNINFEKVKMVVLSSRCLWVSGSVYDMSGMSAISMSTKQIKILLAKKTRVSKMFASVKEVTKDTLCNSFLSAPKLVLLLFCPHPLIGAIRQIFKMQIILASYHI